MDSPVSAPLAAAQAAPARKLSIAWPQVVLAMPGVALSIYSIIVHNRIKAGVSGACGISESCDVVIGSKDWGEFWGIPLGYFGLAFFAVVLVTAFSTSGKPKADALQRLAVATVGTLFSLGLEYVMWVVIKAGCPVCISVHILNFLNFGFALAGWLKVRRQAAG
jgi:uncharacterized membrane protein